MANLSFLNALIKCSIDCPSMCIRPINVQCPQCLPQCMLYEIGFDEKSRGYYQECMYFLCQINVFESLNPWPRYVSPYDVIGPQWINESKCVLSDRGFKNTYELVNLRALKISTLYKICIFHFMCKIFCMDHQRYPIKFHTKYITHTLKDEHFILRWKYKNS